MLTRLWMVGIAVAGICGCESPDVASLDQAAAVEIVADSGTLAADEARRYGPFTLHAGDHLRAVLAMDNGDADVYLGDGAMPTASQYDCRPYLSGTAAEQCDMDGPAEVYVEVVGFRWSTDFTLSVTKESTQADICGNGIKERGEICDGSTMACQDLNRDGWVGGDAPCKSDCSGFDTSMCEDYAPGAAKEKRFIGGYDESLAQGQWQHYGPFNTVAGDFRALIGHNPMGNPGSGDVDLYVGRGTWPTKDSYECRSAGPAANESCTVEGGGLIYVSIYSYENGPQGYGYARYSSEMYYWADEDTVQPELHHAFNLIDEGAWRVFGPYDGGDATVQVILAGGGQLGLGDADLYVRAGAPPTATEHDCRPYESGSDERCTLTSPGKFWVGVNGYKRSLYSLRTAIISH